jgi:tetratricopeptide (TPR) repeat protein
MKKEFTKLVILVTVLLMILASNPVHADLIALWEFDFENATDSYGDNHGKLNGYPDFSTGHANIGRALELNGDDYISIANESNFDINDKITIAAWIKVNKFNKSWQAIVTKGDSAWRLARTDQKETLAFHLTGVTSNNNGLYQNLGVEGNVNVEDGRWHHAAGVYDESKVYLYIDGILDKSLDASGTIATNNYEVCIGENAERWGRCFVGLIDDVAIFNHALNPEQVNQLYNGEAASFIPKSYMTQLAEEAENKAKKLKPKETIDFLEKKIEEYEKWRANNVDDIKLHDRRLSSDVYFLLAKAKEASDVPIQDVIVTYKQSVTQPQKPSNYVPDALLWLFDKIPTDEYTDIVKDCVCNSDDPFYNIYHIAKNFESNGNWAAFELFLDAILSEVDDPLYYAAVVDLGLKKDEAWADKFSQYCRSKPELTEYLFRKHEKIARKYIMQKNFKKAIEVYQDIVQHCGPHQQKCIYELKLFECQFSDGQYESVIQNLDSFIDNNKATQRTLIIKAMLLKGQSYVHLGKLDQAIDTFIRLMIEYPEVPQAPQANFFVGYCNMLQSDFKEATEAFNLVVENYPESSYANQARSSLSRIKNMTD